MKLFDVSGVAIALLVLISGMNILGPNEKNGYGEPMGYLSDE